MKRVLMTLAVLALGTVAASAADVVVQKRYVQQAPVVVQPVMMP